MNRLHEVTSMMVLKKDNIDYIIEQLGIRQTLMDQFDALLQGNGRPFSSDIERDRVDELVKDMVDMDRTLAGVLADARDDIKSRLSSSKNNQAILGYTNNALSGSGSYMDYKK